jgi:L-cysteine/cystine lyase
MTDPTWFRAQFPVFERLAFMNAGSEGPIPRRSAEAVQARLHDELEGGRGGRPYFMALLELASTLRARCADLLGYGRRQHGGVRTRPTAGRRNSHH